MTILATIHTPSSEIFHTFDRVILLANGYTIYNGKTADVMSFFEAQGIKIHKY
jgi:ABC-type multidrug transport system ATPase subunit